MLFPHLLRGRQGVRLSVTLLDVCWGVLASLEYAPLGLCSVFATFGGVYECCTIEDLKCRRLLWNKYICSQNKVVSTGLSARSRRAVPCSRGRGEYIGEARGEVPAANGGICLYQLRGGKVVTALFVDILSAHHY